jgi:hypothetical protein
MLADIAEGQIATIHSQDDKGPRDAEDSRCIGGTQFLILGDYRYAFAAEQA